MPAPIYSGEDTTFYSADEGDTDKNTVMALDRSGDNLLLAKATPSDQRVEAESYAARKGIFGQTASAEVWKNLQLQDDGSSARAEFIFDGDIYSKLALIPSGSAKVVVSAFVRDKNESLKLSSTLLRREIDSSTQAERIENATDPFLNRNYEFGFSETNQNKIVTNTGELKKDHTYEVGIRVQTSASMAGPAMGGLADAYGFSGQSASYDGYVRYTAITLNWL